MSTPSLPLSLETLEAAPLGVRRALGEIVAQSESDLAPAGGGHWSEADWAEIMNRVDRNFAALVMGVNEENELRAKWSSVVTDFHRQNHWGFIPQVQRRKKPVTEEQKRFREFVPYAWAFIQSTLIIKFAVYYFGLSAADDPSTFNLVGLIVCLGISFFSLVYFAYRHHQKTGGDAS